MVEVVEFTDYAVVYPRGYLNGPMGENVDVACGELVRKGYGQIIINFRNVETMNTMGIANLVSVLEKVGRRSGVVYFCNLLYSNRQILDVLDISRSVLIFEDESTACRHLQERAARPH